MQKRVLYIAFLLLAICNKIVAEDQITISDFNLYPGDTKEVSVVLTNEDTYVGFQFDLYLPEGLTVESFSASSRIPEGTTPQMAQQTDGCYRFVAAALGGNPIAGNNGSVLTLTVKAGDSIAVKDYTGYLRNVKISKADGSGVVIAEQPFTVTVNATVWSVIGTINGNWDTDSEMTSTDGVNYTVTIPYLNADTYEFKIRANGDWTENYGLNGAPDGQNIPVTVPEDNTGVVITFNKDTKEISYSLVLPVYTVSGDFNGWSDSEAMTKDANGIYFVTIDGIDAGGHEFKIKTNNSWDVNYGLNGLRGGDNIPFTVAGNSSVTFYFDPSTKIASTVYPLAPEPYAVVTEVTATENTVTLYYDNLRNSHERTADIGDFMGDWTNLSSTVTTVTFDPSFAAYRPTSTAWWFSGFSNMTAINGIENLCTDDVTDMNAMFMSCTSLPSIDLSHFNTGQVVDMSSLFNECTSLTELDLSSFNTANVSNMEWMFYQCSSLKTIYIGEHWSIANVSSSQEMFNGCTVLTGGNGTTFNENNVTAAYAHLDGGTANPGYFTPKDGYGMAAKPMFTHEGNLVFVNSATEGATIRYTIDDVAPTDTTGIVYSDSIQVTRNCTIRAIATKENFTPSEVTEYNVDWFKVANVEFDQNGHTITLTTQTDGATIHYTLSNSGAGEQIYSAPLTLDADCTIEAYATRDGYTPSDTTSFVFHADGVTCSNPVFARNENVITISTQTENAQIYYTTDGTEPTSQSQLYADSIVVDRNMTIKAIAMRENYYPSQVTTFVVDWFKCEKPTMAWNGDVLTISCATEGATIYYSAQTKDEFGNYGADAFALYNQPFEYRNDALLKTYAAKEGWTNSDTLVIEYPYTAWQELLAAVTDANAAIQQATGNDNVPQQMLNELESVKDTALMMYSYRTAEEAVINEKTAQLRELTDAVLRLANAEAEPYAVLTGDTISGMTLTFYYDKKKQERNGMDITIFNSEGARPWHQLSSEIAEVSFDQSFAKYTPTSTAFWLYGMSNLAKVNNISYLVTDSVTDMRWMFAYCSNLETLDVSRFNTDKVTGMGAMFHTCSNLTAIDVSGFNTSNVKDFTWMFLGCSSLTSLDVSKFNTGNAESLKSMFDGCSKLSIIDVRNFDTRNVRNMYGLFSHCTALTSVDLTGFNTENVESLNRMFDSCPNLTTIDLSSFNTSKVTDVPYMFCNNSSLTTIYVSDLWTTESVTDGNFMFMGCNNLVGGQGTTYTGGHMNHEYAHIDGGPSNPGYFTRSGDDPYVAPEYTFDGTTGVLAINGGTTLADALDAAGGRDEVAKTITAIVWNSTATLTNSDLQGLDNPNMLVYVQSASQAPANRDNVVIGNDSTGYTAKNIKLTDVTEGNGDFYCPIAFTAEMISYTHEYRQQTEVGVSRGWETIAMPFTVQTIMHETKDLITPFGTDSINKHFWLRQLTQQGLAQARQIKANTPYLISMPNSAAYSAGFNLNGRVTFSSQNVGVPVTQLNGMEAQTGAGDMVLLQPNFKGQSATAMIYALNVGVERDDHPEGSVFVANYRLVRPFEAFTVHHGNGPAPQFISISEMNGDVTGIEDVRCKMSDGRGDNWYDLNGRRLQQKPTKKGIYILNGKKTIIK